MSDYGHDLEFGVFITPSNGQPHAVVELAQMAERSGLDLVSFQDHPYQAAFLDTWTLISYVAAATERISIAPNVLNLPLRPPAVVARAAASLDLLSGGRFELGIGAGGFWDAIEAMGGRRLTPGQSVDALAEAIELMRAFWDSDERRGVRFEGEHYQVRGARRGPAPAHPISIWIGAYKPRMLRLTGRLGDGWLPSLPYLEPGQLQAGNTAIDEAAREAGREPSAIRRLLNINGQLGGSGDGELDGPAEQWVEVLSRWAIDDGIGSFIAMADDAVMIEALATEIAPAVRERVAEARAAAAGQAPAAPTGAAGDGDAGNGGAATSDEPQDEYDRLGVHPTPDDGTRFAPEPLWDEASRPQRPESSPDVEYSRRGRAIGQHLIDVHDNLRKELTELRGIIAQVEEGALSAGDARSSLNEMALRQNDWTLGAFCSRYCRAVAQHHSLEDEGIFPHLRRSEKALEPVIDRLTEEHLVIHDAIEAVDKALVAHINKPDDFSPLQLAIDNLTDALISHLSYEEFQLVEPLARHGFYPGQL